MATFVTVAQEGSELLRRNAEQTQAARLNKLEGDEQKRTEAKARDERRAALLQQSQDASGNALGSNRRQRFRPQEPAASFLPYKVLLVSWDGTTPVLSDPGSAVVSQPLTNIGPTLLSGAPAITTTSANYCLGGGTYETTIRPVAQANLTVETWGQLSFSGTMDSAGVVYAELGWESPSEGSQYVRITGVYYPSGFNGAGLAPNVAPGFYITANAPGYLYDPVKVNDDPSTPFHLCVQRVASNYYFYLNGVLLRTHLIGSSSVNMMAGAVSIISVIQSSLISAPNKLGQTRYTAGRARYPVAGFAPDSIPLLPR